MSIDKFKPYLFNLPENHKNFKDFFYFLKRGNCVALVGAGLSKQVGLPTWDELILDLCRERDIKCSKGEIKSDRDKLYDIAQDIKNSLSEKDYLGILTRKFTPPDMDYGETHLHLLETNFCSFLTTNYDDCLERAVIKLFSEEIEKNVQVYPILNQTLLRQRTIFYLHGKIKKGVIVFTKNDYEQAYKQHNAIESVLWDAYSQMSIVIICCSFEDKYIIELFEKCKRKLDNQNAVLQKLIRSGKISSNTGKHFILIGLRENNNANNNTEDVRRIMENYRVRFEELNIHPIFYKVLKDGSHRNLKILLEKLPKYEPKKKMLKVEVTYEP